MPSKARQAFTGNSGDITRLLKIHRDIGGDGAGQRYGLEVLNKSAVVLVTAFWEAYCEDLAAEAVEAIVVSAPSAGKLSKHIRKIVAEELKKEKHDLSVWSLADDGWRKVLHERLGRLREERNWNMMSPTSAKIDKLFEESIGLPRVSSGWYWAGMSANQARKKLDRFVALRGDIAHRGMAARSCKKTHVTDYFEFIKRIIGKTGDRVNKHVKDATGSGLW